MLPGQRRSTDRRQVTSRHETTDVFAITAEKLRGERRADRPVVGEVARMLLWIERARIKQRARGAGAATV